MSDLTFKERRALEQCFHMRGGYVLDFSNRTFEEFVKESTGRDIYDQRYNNASGSKANLLRKFWEIEPNHLAGKLIHELLDLCDPASDGFMECWGIARRLQASPAVEALDAIAVEGDGKSFEAIAKAARDAIETGEPEEGIDRLHTYVTKLLRKYARRRGIAVPEAKPLHSVFGEYVKALRGAGVIETEMGERILKSTISILEAFNQVRNDRSLAHDNEVLGRDESLLIYGHVCGVLRFIRAAEEKAASATPAAPQDFDPDELPF